MLQYAKAKIVAQLISFFGQDYRRINHALAVLKESERLAETSPAVEDEILIAAALLHDVGIKPSETQLGYNNGHTQEKYGPAEAEKLLRAISFPEDKIRKVGEIVGNHHSPSRFDYPELAILKKADALVNKREVAEAPGV